MNWTDAQLIQEAVVINHKQVGAKTAGEYARCLEHFSAYLASVHNATFYTARQRHVLLYLAHLKDPATPAPNGAGPCEWCSEHGDTAGAAKGLGPSTRKKHLCAIGFLYHHFHYEDDLPDLDPSAHVSAPRCPITRAIRPPRPRSHDCYGARAHRKRGCWHWVYFAPSPRDVRDVRWRELDLDAGKWWFIGKKEKADALTLHPALVRELRRHRKRQGREAEKNPRVANALADPNTAYVLSTRTGRRLPQARSCER